MRIGGVRHGRLPLGTKQELLGEDGDVGKWFLVHAETRRRRETRSVSPPSRHPGLDPGSRCLQMARCERKSGTPDQVRGDGASVAGESPHHLPPRSSIALSSARFDGVRRVPLLRGRSGRPASARRAAKRAARSAMSITGCASGLEVFEAIIATGLFADTALKIVHLGVGVKAQEDARLFKPVCRRAGGILAHAIGDEVFHRNDAEQSLADRRRAAWAAWAAPVWNKTGIPGEMGGEGKWFLFSAKQ